MSAALFWTRRLTRLAVVVFAVGLAAPASAQDTVDVASPGAARGRTRLAGQVIDYTGRQLVIELPGGRRQEVPGDRVLRVETQYGPQQMQADQLLEKGRFGEALPLYRAALDAEQRRWVRRLIMARMVWCHQGLDQPGPACEAFLLLVQSDPATPYFDCIPLAWAPTQPALALERAAATWLAQSEKDSPAAVLLGASHLLSTAQGPSALERLKGLAVNPDRRIAQLAYAQTWRAAANVDDAQLEAWRRLVEEMPEPLRAGPYYVLGRAWAQRQKWDEAALCLLRVPILYPQHRGLAARALLEAGHSLERLGQTERAAGLYREAVKSYAGSPSAAEGRSRLEAMEKTPAKGS